MATRNEARTRAFQILFEADQRGIDALTALADWIRLFQAGDGDPLSAYTVGLVEGYAKHTDRIDELISTYAMGWTLDRMPAADRNILRLGAYELLWEDGTPDVVAIDEAVQLAKAFSTPESPAFVNGLLGRFQALKPHLRPQDQDRSAAGESTQD